MKLRIGKPAIAPQADEPIVPLQKSAGASPFSKLLRAANDEPRVTVPRTQASALPANDPAREVPLLTVAHGPLQAPPNPGRRASDVVKTPAPERGLVERLRVVSESKPETPAVPKLEVKPKADVAAQPGGRRATDATPRVAPQEVTHVATTNDKSIEVAQPKKPVAAATSALESPEAPVANGGNSTPQVATSVAQSTSPASGTTATTTASPTKPQSNVNAPLKAGAQAMPTSARSDLTSQMKAEANSLQPTPSREQASVENSELPNLVSATTGERRAPQTTTVRSSSVQPHVPPTSREQTRPTTIPSSSVQGHVPLASHEQSPVQAHVALTSREQTRPTTVHAPLTTREPGPASARPTVTTPTNVVQTNAPLTDREQPARAAQANAPLTPRQQTIQPNAAPPSIPLTAREQPSPRSNMAQQKFVAEQPSAARPTTNLQSPSQKNAEPSRPSAIATPTLTPSPHELESPRPEPKLVTSGEQPTRNTLHRRRVVDSNVQEKPNTEKNAPAQSPTAPLVTTSNTSFVAAPDQRPVARASPDTPVAPLPQDLAHRPSSTVRDEATPTPSHAPALREPPAIAATPFSVSPTVTATAVDTKHFGTASQALKSQPATTAPIARHAAEPRPTSTAARAPQGHVAQVLEFAAQRTTRPTELEKNATPETPAQRKLERVETKKAADPERDDKTVTPLPTQPAPLQPTDLPPPQRIAEASAPQQPNPLPNVAPAYLEDPSLRVVVLPNIARLSVETQDSGTLSLQVKVHDGVTDIRAAGPAASLVEARQGELRLALAHEGLALGHFDLTQSDHQGAPQHHFEPHDEREPLPRRTHVRPESSSNSTTRAEGRLSVKA